MAKHPSGQFLLSVDAPQPSFELPLACRPAFAFQRNQPELVLQARRDAKEQARRDRLAAEEAERILVSGADKPAPS